MDKGNLVKLGGNRYLDPNDPKFLEKITREYPHLKDELAKQYKHLITPIESSTSTSSTTSTTPISSTTSNVTKTTNPTSKSDPLLLRVLKGSLIALLIVLIFLILFVLAVKYEENKNMDHFKRLTASVNASNQDSGIKPISLTSDTNFNSDTTGEVDTITSNLTPNIQSPGIKAMSAEEAALKSTVLRSALENYHDVHGKYPLKGNVLAEKAPDNWLSFIPSDMNYSPDGGTYRVWANGFDPNCSCKPSNLELAFYPETNQIALMQGKTALSVYSVASAKKGSEIPFTESKVSQRVVDPNGGDGPFGKRGLVLEKNYAIHGTNNEDLIGQRVSHGCLRMKNADIEELYPYVSLGTPFKVKSGAPDSPVYPKGLPDLGGKVNTSTESTPNVFYVWNL
jgi:hypothetical protein